QDLAIKLLESDIKEAKSLEEDLQKQCETEKAVAVAFNAQRAPFVALEMDLKRLRSFYDTVNLRIRQVNLGGDAGAISTQVIEPPQEPGAPVSPNLKKVVLACTLLGLFFGLILCYLAIAFAKSGMRVLLIDGDLRRPRLRDLFDLPRTIGLSQLLQDPDFKEADLEKAIQLTSIANLDVLPSGPNPPNPTELLTGEKFGRMLAWAE